MWLASFDMAIWDNWSRLLKVKWAGCFVSNIVCDPATSTTLPGALQHTRHGPGLGEGTMGAHVEVKRTQSSPKKRLAGRGGGAFGKKHCTYQEVKLQNNWCAPTLKIWTQFLWCRLRMIGILWKSNKGLLAMRGWTVLARCCHFDTFSLILFVRGTHHRSENRGVTRLYSFSVCGFIGDRSIEPLHWFLWRCWILFIK